MNFKRLLQFVVTLASLLVAESVIAQVTGGPGRPRVIPPPTCAAPATAAFPGGYRADVYCNNQLIGGIGSTGALARANSQAFASLLSLSNGQAWYLPSSEYVRAIQGGYIAKFYSSGGYISGLGSTATAAGENAFAFAQLNAATGKRAYYALPSQGAVGEILYAFAGGFVANFYDRNVAASGVGSTLTAAGVNAYGFAEISEISGRRYSLHPTNVNWVQGGYVVTFSNSGGSVSGVGDTATAAGLNALGFGAVHVYGNRPCSTNTSSISYGSGQYRVSFFCVSRVIEGFGRTITAAGEDALRKAQDQW